MRSDVPKRGLLIIFIFKFVPTLFLDRGKGREGGELARSENGQP